MYLRDIWPSRLELQEVERQHVLPAMFRETYAKITDGNKNWNELEISASLLYPWDSSSTYIQCPPFFKDLTLELPRVKSIDGAFALLNLGDSVTTGNILKNVLPWCVMWSNCLNIFCTLQLLKFSTAKLLLCICPSGDISHWKPCSVVAMGTRCALMCGQGLPLLTTMVATLTVLAALLCVDQQWKMCAL